MLSLVFTPIVARFASAADHFVVESVRYAAKLRGTCDRPLRLANPDSAQALRLLDPRLLSPVTKCWT